MCASAGPVAQLRVPNDASLERHVSRPRRVIESVFPFLKPAPPHTPLPKGCTRSPKMLFSHDGAKIAYMHYTPAEPRNKLKLMFGNGWLCHPMIWRRQIVHFGPQYEFFTMKTRGHWDSELGQSTSETYLRDCAKDLKALMDKEGVDKAVLVMHSMSGLVALYFAEMYPERVSALVLVSSLYGSPLKTFFIKRMARATKAIKMASQATESVVMDVLKQTAFIQNPFIQEFIRLAIDGKVVNQRHITRWDWNRFFQHLCNVDSRTMDVSFRAMIDSNGDFSEMLGGIKVPVLIVAGTADPVVLCSASEQLAHKIPGAEFELFQETGHLVMMEFYEKFNAMLEDFLRRRVEPRL